MRAIAAAASVSPGLVIHHYGSKDGLRVACDQYVAQRIYDVKAEATSAGLGMNPLAPVDALAAEPPIAGYLARALVEDSSHVADLVDALVANGVALCRAGCGQWPDESGPRRVRPRRGDHDLVARGAGAEPSPPAAARRVGVDPARSVPRTVAGVPGRRDRHPRQPAAHRADRSAVPVGPGCGRPSKGHHVTAAIEISGLVKTFGNVTALDGLDLRVEAGEVHGFLGPNGAGKSTTIRVLLGLLRADSGHASVLGMHPWTDAVALHRELAYVPGDVNLWPNLTGGQAIDFFARLRGDYDKARRDELIERFDLDPTKKARTYSKGNRQKVALVAALASDAQLLLLDEPTAGLDPLMEAVFQEVLREDQSRGRTVLLSSHILAQVEKLADRVSIIRLGRTMESGTLEELRHLTRSTVTAHLVRPPTGLAELPGVHDLRQDNATISFDVDGEHLPTAIAFLSQLGLTSLVCQPPTLEQLFLRHYGDDLTALGA